MRELAIYCLPALSLEERLTLCSSSLDTDAILTHAYEYLNRQSRWPLKEVEKEFLKLLEWRAQNDNCVVTYKDQNYPPLLRTIEDAPFLLTYRGSLELKGIPLTIVGTNNPSRASEEAAFKLALECGSANGFVISALERGISSAVHGGSYAVKRGSWALLPFGLDKLSKGVFSRVDQILAHKGAIISEFQPHLKATQKHFCYRNRLLAAISPVTVIIDENRRSTASVTAEYALDYGRSVVVHSAEKESIGSALFINDGAAVVAWLGDIEKATKIAFNAHLRAIEAPREGPYYYRNRGFRLVTAL
ncbi:MAG: DNA-processing protein DprA [Sphaerochaetaceae bacterium]